VKFSSKYYVKKRHEFFQIQKYSTKIYSKNFTFFFLKKPYQDTVVYPRLGVTVSKKVSKKAVKRNKLKRRIKEAFRLFILTEISNTNMGAVDIVVTAKPTACDLDWSEVKKEFINSYTKFSSKEIR
jgi:ribonuclease P protein component